MNLSNRDIREKDHTPFCAQPNDIAPLFIAEAYNNVEKKIGTIRLDEFRGKWVILFFYPSDFTLV